MATQVQNRRGTTAEHSTFTGAVGEVTIDTDKDTVVVHDGSTAGGNPLMREDGSNSALALGSAGTPSLKFTGDTNTGIYSPGADQVAISTNGTGRLFVDSTGRVGIGTSSISTISERVLHIYAGTGASSGLRLTGNAGTGLDLIHGTDGSGYLYQRDNAFLAIGTNNLERLRITSTGALNFVGAGTAGSTQAVSFNGSAPVNSLVIDSTGKVGIGSSNPQTLLHLSNTAQQRFNCLSTANAISFWKDGTPTFAAEVGIGGATGITSTMKFDIYNGSAWNTAMTIDSSSRVGIGTTTVSTTLEVVNSSTPIIRVGDGTRHVQLWGGSSTQNQAVGTATAASFGFNINSSEVARFDTSGRLLVGTSSSRSVAGIESSLQIEGGAYSGATFITNSANGAGSYLSLAKSRGTSGGSTTIVQSGDTLGVVSFSAADGTDLATEAATITAQVDGTPGANDMPGRLVFSTTADGAASPTERMRIKSTGTVQVGNGTLGLTGSLVVDPSSNAAGYPITVNNPSGGTTNEAVIDIYRQGVRTGYITNTNTATFYTSTSDYRVKENVTAITDGIARLQKLKPSCFNFIVDPGKIVDGFIAHEVQSVVPEAIIGEKDAVDDKGNPIYQGIDQSKLVPLLTAALQELVAEVENLKAEVAAFKAQ